LEEAVFPQDFNNQRGIVKSFSSPAKRLFTVAAAVSMAGALTLAVASSASAAQDNHPTQATASQALPAGAHILKSGSNQYGSYEFVEQAADKLLLGGRRQHCRGTDPEPGEGAAGLLVGLRA
jgi:hypothetical protein